MTITNPRLLVAERPERCEVCGAGVQLLWAPEDIARERADAPRGLDDVVVHEAPASVWQCWQCRCLSRALSADAVRESEGRYRSARYAADQLEQLRRRARADLDRDRQQFHGRGLQPGARVLEIGSYAGAFLDLARDEGCRATGIDINEQLIHRCVERGLDVRMGPFAAADFAAGEFDSVWILNCFEELSDPRRVLAEVARVLRPDGTLSIRTPNAAFLGIANPRVLRPLVARIREANGLAGVPFARCFTARALARMLQSSGFTDVQVVGREFSRLRPVGWPWWWSALRPVRRLGYGAASVVGHGTRHPWFEVVARRAPGA